MSDQNSVSSVFSENYQAKIDKTFENSSNVSRIRYETNYQWLFVVFKSGKTYKYSGVPLDIAKQLFDENIQSIGKELNKLILRNYPHTLIE